VPPLDAIESAFLSRPPTVTTRKREVDHERFTDMIGKEALDHRRGLQGVILARQEGNVRRVHTALNECPNRV
jgi:hypothetical protein